MHNNHRAIRLTTTGLLVSVLVSLLGGCTVLAAGIGAAVDAAHTTRSGTGDVSIDDHVSALTEDGNTVRGQVQGITETGITVRDESCRVVLVLWSDIAEIRSREVQFRDPIWNGAVTGLAVGLVLDVVVLSAASTTCEFGY